MMIPQNCERDRNQFLLLCVSDQWNGSRELFADLVKAAADSDELVNLIANSADPEIRRTQAYAVASRSCPDGGHWKRLRALLGSRVNKTISDAGGLKIGNDSFSVIIPNGRGDGTTRYAVIDKDEFWIGGFMNYFAPVDGEIRIYDYDCGNDVAETITGRYGVYTFDGIVVFERWE